MELDGAPPAPEPEPAPQAGGFEGVRSIFFYNTEPEVGQVTGLNLFEYRYRLMAKRCEEVASRKHQIIFLPNEKDYVGAHGDVGLLATMTQYRPDLSMRNEGELPQACVTLRFDARVLVLWHWVEPDTGELHECTFRRLPGDGSVCRPPVAVFERVRDALNTSQDSRYVATTQRGFLNVHSNPLDPFATDNIVGQLAEGQQVVALERAADGWLRHALGWSISRLRGPRFSPVLCDFLWLTPCDSQRERLQKAHRVQILVGSTNAERRHVLVHAPSTHAAASAVEAISEIAHTDGSVLVPVHLCGASSTVAASLLLERLASIWIRDGRDGQSAADTGCHQAPTDLPLPSLRRALDQAGYPAWAAGREDDADGRAQMETALLKLQLDDQAATAAGAALEGLGVCTAFGCPCYMRVAHCHFERRSVLAAGRDAGVKRDEELLARNVCARWGDILPFDANSQYESHDLYCMVQYQWEEAHLAQCPDMSETVPASTRVAHAAALQLHAPDDECACAHMPARFAMVQLEEAERCIRRFLLQSNWCRLRLLFLAQRDASSHFSRFDNEMLRAVAEWVLVED